MKKILRRICYACLITTLILSALTAGIPNVMGKNPKVVLVNTVNADEAETINVGFCKMGGFAYYDDMGNLSGYYLDYLKRIAMITGWNYNFIEFDDMETAQKMLKNREIDLLAPCQMTAELMSEFDFSQYSFGTEYSVIVTKSDNQDIYYEDFEGFNNRRLGVVDSYAVTQNFGEYMEENGFKADLVYYGSADEAMKALDDDEIELLLMDQMMTKDGYKIVARFEPYPFYFMSWKGNSDMLEKLNVAIQNLKNTYPGLENELLTTYFPLYNIQFFTKEEQEFIDSLQPIKVAYVPENIPISFKNSETGELDGISRKIFDRIQEVSGLTFEYEELPSGDITYDYLRENNFSLITGVRYNRSNLYSRGIMLTNPYLSSKMVFVGNVSLDFDINENYTVAILSGSQTLKTEVMSNYPNFTVVSFDTVEECFESVRSKKTDLLLTDRYIANYWISKPYYEKLYTIPVDGLLDELCFTVVVDIYGNETLDGINGVTLVSIINKTLSQISQDEIDEITINEVIENRYEYKLDDFIYNYRYAFMVAAVSLAIAAVILAYARNLRRKADKLQKDEAERISIQNKRYQMMMDSSGEMLYDISIAGDGGFVSEQIKKKFGWSIPDRVPDFSMSELMRIFHIHPKDWATEGVAVKRALEEKRPSDSLVRIVDERGRYIWCKIYFFPLLDLDENLVSIIGKIEDVDEEIKEKTKLMQASQTDGMTGLMNKQTFESEVRRILKEEGSYHSGIIFVDLDHFKNVNDSLGHSIGDEVIKEAARKLRVLFANMDLVARFGGDEFCVFVDNIPKATLEDKLERMITIMSKEYTDGNLSVGVTASVGAVYSNIKDADYRTLLEQADQAVYEAKDRGRNQYIMHEI